MSPRWEPGDIILRREVLHAGHTSWNGHGKLMLHRPGDPYSVDLFWSGPQRVFDGYYFNLQDPLRRQALGFDTLDHELDYWWPVGRPWEVKDAELFEQRIAEGRYSNELGLPKTDVSVARNVGKGGSTTADRLESRRQPAERRKT